MNRRFYLALLTAIFCASSVAAQMSWVLVKRNRQDFGAVFATRFINENYGFILPYAGGMVGTFRTTDGGITWAFGTDATIGIAGRVKDLQWNTPSQLYCITDNGQFFLYGSQDSGKSWKYISNMVGRSNQLYVKGDSIYLGGGRYSYNAGKQFYVLPLKNFRDALATISGNKDNSIMFSGDDSGDHGCLNTIDYGKTWKIGDFGDANFALYSVPYTLTYFRATESPLKVRYIDNQRRDDSSTVERTTDGGATWKTVLNTLSPDSAPLYLAGGITGGGCAVYAQGTFKAPNYSIEFPTYQSTDLGNTWKSIGGPAQYYSQHISAVARGAILYVGDGKGGLWKFTDSSLLRNATWDLSLERTGTSLSSDTLYTTACDSTILQLNYGFSACDYVLMDSIGVEGIPISSYSSHYRLGHVIKDGRNDTASISFHPLVSGTYPIKIHTFIKRDDWIVEDTAITVILVVKPNPAVLTIDKTDTIDFGRQLLCNLHPDSNNFSLSNLGCELLDVQSIRLETDAPTELKFDPIAGFTVASGDPQKNFVITYNPKTVGIKHGRIIITTNVGIDTIALVGTILPDTRILQIASDTLKASVCNSTEGIVTIQNLSCRFMALDSLDLPVPYQLLPGQLPATMNPNQKITLRIRFAPLTKGVVPIVAKATLRFFAPTGAEQFDTTLNLVGIGEGGTGTLEYDPKVFAFPSLSICAHDSSSGYITNTGCDTIGLAPRSIIGDPDYTISNSPQITVFPKDTIRYTVYLNPARKGIRSGFIVLTTSDLSGSRVDSIPMSTKVLDGTRILSASNSTLNFGSTSLCAERDTVVTLKNTGCDTLWISGIGVAGSGFGVEDAAPFFILKGESKTISITTKIDTTNHQSSNSALLSFTTNADNIISPISLKRFINYPKEYSVRFTVDNTNGKNQNELTMQVLADSLPIGLTRLDATLSIGNTDLLSYINSTSQNTVSLNGNQLTIIGNPITTTNNVLADLHYKIYLTKDSTTDIRFSNVIFNNADQDYSNCIATVQGGASTAFDYQFTCGEPTLSSYLRSGELRITSISPNPTRAEITLSIQSPMKEDVNIEIFDILGKQVMSSTRSLVKGENILQLDTKQLPRGRYSVRINDSAISSFVKE